MIQELKDMGMQPGRNSRMYYRIGSYVFWVDFRQKRLFLQGESMYEYIGTTDQAKEKLMAFIQLFQDK